MLSRRDCIRFIPLGLFLPSFFSPFEKVFAEGALPLGLDTLYRQVSADGKSEIICYPEVDLTIDIVPGDRATTILADRITVSGTLTRPGINLTLLAREIVCGAGAKIDLSGAPPLKTSPKAKNGPNPGDPGADGRNGAGGNHGGNLVIYAGTITGSLSIESNGGAGGDAEAGGDGAKGKTGSPWRPFTAAGKGGKGGHAGKAGSPGDGGNAGMITVMTLDNSFANPTFSLAAGRPGLPALNGGPGEGGNPGPGGSQSKVPRTCMVCEGLK
jgi:hypothetical protein